MFIILISGSFSAEEIWNFIKLLCTKKNDFFFVLFPSSSINIYVHYQIYGCDGVNINAWCNKMIRSWLVLLSCFFYLKFFIWNMWNYIREIDFFARANKRCQIDEMANISFLWVIEHIVRSKLFSRNGFIDQWYRRSWPIFGRNLRKIQKLFKKIQLDQCLPFDRF